MGSFGCRVENGGGRRGVPHRRSCLRNGQFPGPGCAYAEFAAVPAEHLALKPLNVSHEEAAAAAQSPLTAWQALVETGRIGAGARVLIHGGAGGVGHHAVQIAKTLGCYVISTAAGRDAGFVRNLGADEVIDFNTERFEERAKEIDFVLDTVGGENFVRSLHASSRRHDRAAAFGSEGGGR